MLPLVDLHDLLEADGQTQGVRDTGAQRCQATPTAKQQAVIILEKEKKMCISKAKNLLVREVQSVQSKRLVLHTYFSE